MSKLAKRKDRLAKIEEDRLQEELSTQSYEEFNEGFGLNSRGANDEDDFLKENSQWNKEFKENPRNYEF